MRHCPEDGVSYSRALVWMVSLLGAHHRLKAVFDAGAGGGRFPPSACRHETGEILLREPAVNTPDARCHARRGGKSNTGVLCVENAARHAARRR